MKHNLKITTHRIEHPVDNAKYGYVPEVKIAEAYATHMPSNCAVVIYVGKVWAGPCCKPLVDGVCPEHGKIKLCPSPTSSPQ